MTEEDLAALIEQYTGLTYRKSAAYAQAYRLAHAVMTANAPIEQEPELSIPQEDDDPDETNLAQHIREGFEAEAADDKLTRNEEMLAFDYFRAGWKAAIAKYSAPETWKELPSPAEDGQ